jgi:hypothetical protein
MNPKIAAIFKLTRIVDCFQMPLLKRRIGLREQLISPSRFAARNRLCADLENPVTGLPARLVGGPLQSS